MRLEWPGDLSTFVEIEEELLAIGRATRQLASFLTPKGRKLIHDELRYIGERGEYSSQQGKILVRAVFSISMEHVRRGAPLTREALIEHLKHRGIAIAP